MSGDNCNKDSIVINHDVPATKFEVPQQNTLGDNLNGRDK